jgi:protein TonB
MNSDIAKPDDFPHADSACMRAAQVKPVLRSAHQLTARHSYQAEAVHRGGRCRNACAVAIAIALHLAAFYYLTAHTVPVELTNEPGGLAQTISVSLVAAPPVPVATKPIMPEVPKPVTPPVRKSVKSSPVLATHDESPRVVAQQDETKPQHEAEKPQPEVQQAPAASPAAASPAAPSLPAASDNSKLMALPKAIDSSALHQLQCRIPAPLYPPRAKRLGEAGTVKVQFTIGIDGRFSSVHVVGSSSFVDLDGAAIQAVSAGTCQPYLQNGTAVAVTAVQPVSFNLGD